MIDAERAKKLIAEKAYNQCSITIRVDGEETEIPIDFGHTADEIRQMYPFILPLVNEKVKNPAIEFGEKAKRGDFDDMSDDEYNKVVLNMKEQSKYWYDKQEASVLEIAMRFALDIKLRNFDELVYIFAPIERLDAIKSATLTEEETNKVVRDMRLEADSDLERDAGEHNVKTDAAGKLSFNIYGTDVSDEKYNDALDNLEHQIVSDEVFKSIIDEDAKDINIDKYKSTYKPGAYEEGLVKDGRVDIYNEAEEEKKDAPSFGEVTDDALVETDDEDEEVVVDDEFGEDIEESEEVVDEEVPVDDDMLEAIDADEDEVVEEESESGSFLDEDEDEFSDDEDDEDKKDDEE